MQLRKFCQHSAAGVILLLGGASAFGQPGGGAAMPAIGQEITIPSHLADGQEFTLSTLEVIDHGNDLFRANWTIQEGGGRPLTKGTGAPIADMTSPLVFPRSFNRISALDANSCMGCHSTPFGVPGGGGDFVTGVFVLGQRFDFATFDHNDMIPTRGAVDESGKFNVMQDIANFRATLSMYGSGFIEMLARQITEDLQAIRDTIAPGGSAALSSKGISFGTLSRDAAGVWDTSLVEGLPAPSLSSSPPTLAIRPFHQAGNVVSLRQFSNNAFNHHHGIQSVERFGAGLDPDGDGFVDEMTIADVTAVSVSQATMAIPGRVIPRDPLIEAAVLEGENLFVAIGCADCHVPCMDLDNQGWMYTEPNPFNPSGNLLPSDPYVQQFGTYAVDLTDRSLPLPRPRRSQGRVHVQAFTDFKLHDITSGPGDPNREVLDMQQPAGSAGFFAGNGKFITRKLWGTANEPPYFHHGQYTTLRESVEAHAGEASTAITGYWSLTDSERDSIIEFLKTLQVLPPGTKNHIVDEKFTPRNWPDFPYTCNS